MDWTGGIRAVRARGLTASILGSAVLSCLLWIPIRADVHRHRRMTAASLLGQLHQAVRSYELDWAEYPPGDGNGSRDLVEALYGGIKKPCIFDFEPPPDAREEGLRDGHITNPIDPAAPWPFGIVHYRRNPRGSRPPVDFWVYDRSGPTIHVPGSGGHGP